MERELDSRCGLRIRQPQFPGAHLPVHELAPRLGFAMDVTGNGEQKLDASFGIINDIMKYEMPRGSFAGNVRMDYM